MKIRRYMGGFGVIGMVGGWCRDEEEGSKSGGNEVKIGGRVGGKRIFRGSNGMG